MRSLRDRIAAAALNAYEGNSEAWNWSERDRKRRDWLDVADAVIAELGLQLQVAGPDGIAYGKHRYVTEWGENDD